MTPAFWTPPPIGVVAQGRLVSTVMLGDESGDDRPARTSGGLHPPRSENLQRLGSAIATFDILRIAVGDLKALGKKNVENGTSVPTRWGGRGQGGGDGLGVNR